MLEGNSDRQGCMRYCTCSRMGRMPSSTSLSKRLCVSPALAARLHITTGPSWQWSPTSTSCFTPSTMGMKHSASMACVDSSMSSCLKRRLARRPSPAPTQVVQITSAACRISLSAWARSCLNLRASEADRSPISSFSNCNFRNSALSGASRFLTRLCSARWSTEELMDSLDLAAIRTTRRPVLWIFSVSWSTATLEGAHTSTCPTFCCARWYTSEAEVTVLPVPGGPCISDSGFCSTARTAASCEWFSSGRPGTDNLCGRLVFKFCAATS
mmetsp:Transcript_32940/g.72540  ORF Transcript_32940/g.72540 Transcript_32940/m.72540 type:complete len:270 (-) Transcript_32940:270-1079(-)